LAIDLKFERPCFKVSEDITKGAKITRIEKMTYFNLAEKEIK